MNEGKSAWNRMDSEARKEAWELCEAYKTFLNRGKTEREAEQYAVRLLKEHGFRPLSDYETLRPGDRVFAENRGKGLLAAVMGESLAESLRIVAAHIDSPRLDLKQNPLYEDDSMAFFKTHYYGGIKKYQWTTIPLALHGVIVKKDGTKVTVSVGEEGDDCTFTVTDLLPHLAGEQMKKTASEAVEGEQLNILCGVLPNEEEKDAVKSAVLALLKERYGMEESDFFSAELEMVPAFSAKDIGFDRGMVGGYGQDDRVCAFTGLTALLDTETPKQTAVCLLADKEEIGSMGTTGIQSTFFEDTVSELLARCGETSHLALSRTLKRSACLSADVTAGADPSFPSVQEKQNAAHMGCGTAIMKYTGARGKSGSSDANAEFLAYIRRILDEGNVIWQATELGKVDAGGGGTVAQYMANRNVDTLDIGVPLLSMHAPFEVAAKSDIYMTYLAYRSFLSSNGQWYE